LPHRTERIHSSPHSGRRLPGRPTRWALLPAKELSYGSASTCWRLDVLAQAGVFETLQAALLDELEEAGRIDLDRFSVDSASLRAVKGALTGANPVDQGKHRSKLHVASDAQGLPISLVVSGARRRLGHGPRGGRQRRALHPIGRHQGLELMQLERQLRPKAFGRRRGGYIGRRRSLATDT
jgi:hypothetical protein